MPGWILECFAYAFKKDSGWSLRTPPGEMAFTRMLSGPRRDAKYFAEKDGNNSVKYVVWVAPLKHGST